jgi:hypothetical protein
MTARPTGFVVLLAIAFLVFVPRLALASNHPLKRLPPPAAGCKVLDDPLAKAACDRETRRREKNQSSAAGTGGTKIDDAWRSAIADARSPDLSAVFRPRPVALVVGLVWISLSIRQKLRRRRRVSA